MSGVMLLEDLRDPAHFEAAARTIDTNLLGTVRVIDAFTPHLIRRGSGTLITVTSGIAFLPFPTGGLTAHRPNPPTHPRGRTFGIDNHPQAT